jgi:hypothetical protein
MSLSRCARSVARVVRRVPWARRSSTVSTIEFHEPQAGQRPKYAGLTAPHCWQIKLVFTFGMSIPI